MDNKITKSPEMLVREAKIRELQGVLKKRKSVLKSLKTRLGNTQKEIEDTQRNIQNIMFDKMSKMEALRVEIAELAIKMKANKQFSKADKKALDEIASEFLDGSIFGEGFEEFQEKKRKMEDGDFDFDEDFKAKFNDVFEEFKVKPEEGELRDIRKVFIKLSRKFHPDLADNDVQAQEFHGIMQQINEAYKNNDIQMLLEMEQLYLMEEFDLMANSLTVDVLQQEIERLGRDIDFINNQVDRTSTEIKQLRVSDMGSMLSNVKKADKEGEGLDAMEAEMKRGIDLLEQIKFGFSDSIERGSISPVLLQMMNPFAGLGGGKSPFDDDDDDEMSGLFGEMFSAMMDEDDDDEDYEENENPKFPLGSAVKVKAAVKHPFDDKTSMKDWQGWVDYAFFDEDGKPFYTVNFDIKTMQSMPKELIEEGVDIGEDFQEYDFFEKDLVATTEREKPNDAFKFYRGLKIDVEWEALADGEALVLIKQILKADLNVEAEQNWINYLKSCMPFEAKGGGNFELKRNKKVTVKAVDHLNINVGFTVTIQEEKGKKRPYEYPLVDLITDNEHLNMVLSLHEIWFDELEEEDDDNGFFF
jgi:dimeric dUTPase (all-alpha-NTP-PPase superfamily)